MGLRALTIILTWLNVLTHVVCLNSEWPPCSGGSSLLGLDKWDDKSLRCCESSSGTCHGYDTISLVNNTEVVDSLQMLLDATLPIQKSRFKRNFGKSRSAESLNEIEAGQPSFQNTSCSQIEEHPGSFSSCCSSKASVFYPVTGFSAVSRKRVAIIQIGPFKQPVVFNQCLERGCRVLRGNCTQVYSPQPLYILTTDEGGKLAAKLDFVLVEAGCQCQTRPMGQYSDSSSSSGSAMGVDATVREALRIMTGIDFDEDYFAMLATIDAASAIAGPNQASTPDRRPAASVASSFTVIAPVSRTTTTTSTAATTTADASTTAPVIDPHSGGDQLGSTTTVLDGTVDTPLSSPTSLQTEMITSSFPSPESSHDLSDNEITSTSSPQPVATSSSTTTTTTTTTVLPLPQLPDDGHPIVILPGFFDPVSLLIQSFRNKSLQMIE